MEKYRKRFSWGVVRTTLCLEAGGKRESRSRSNFGHEKWCEGRWQRRYTGWALGGGSDGCEQSGQYEFGWVIHRIFGFQCWWRLRCRVMCLRRLGGLNDQGPLAAPGVQWQYVLIGEDLVRCTKTVLSIRCTHDTYQSVHSRRKVEQVLKATLASHGAGWWALLTSKVLDADEYNGGTLVTFRTIRER